MPTEISTLRIDHQRVQDGEWMPLGDEYGDVEVLVRGPTDRYMDAIGARSRAAARSLGGDPTKLPTAVSRRIIIGCVNEFLLLDVRNLTSNGEPISIGQFKALLEQPDYYPLVSAVLGAAAKVGQQRAEDLIEAMGNFANASDGASDKAES